MSVCWPNYPKVFLFLPCTLECEVLTMTRVVLGYANLQRQGNKSSLGENRELCSRLLPSASPSTCLTPC